MVANFDSRRRSATFLVISLKSRLTEIKAQMSKEEISNG